MKITRLFLQIHTCFQKLQQSVQTYNRQYGVRCKIIRPFNVYGLGQSEKLFLGNIIAQIKKSYSVEIRNVKTSRDFVHIDDLASAFKLAINYQSDFEIFNIGSGYSISVAEIIDIIRELTAKG